MTTVIDFIMLHNRCVSLKNIFILLTYRLISASMLLICWYEAYADFIFMGITDSHRGLCSMITPSRLPCPMPSRGQGLRAHNAGEQEAAHGVLYIHCRGDWRGAQNPPTEMVKKDWNTGLPEPSTPRFSNNHALFLNESPCPNRSVCYSYVHQIIMLWGSTLRAIGPSSKGIQKGKNEIMHLNWVSPYITRKSNYISKMQTALFPWY